MVLISEISSSACHDDDPVESCLTSLVQHYCQPIYFIDEVLPYFHDGIDPEVSPVLSHLISKLNPRDYTAILDRYETAIRPSLIVESKLCESGIPILQHYELLIVELKKGEKSQSCRVDPTTISILCKDITLLTKVSYEDDVAKGNKSRFIRANIVLPTLLRLLHHGLSMTLDSAPIVSTLLAFHQFKLDTRRLLPCLSTKNLLMSECFVPCLSSELVQRIEWLDDTLTELSSVEWNDPNTNLTASVTDTCWNSLGGDVSSVCESIGWIKVAKRVRAHFFGRETEIVSKAPKRPLTYPLSTKATIPEEPVYQTTPSRIHASLHFIAIVPAVNHDILGELLPVCYTLIDSHQKCHVSIGASALTRLLQLAIPQDLLVFEDNMLSILEHAVKVAGREAPALGLLGLALSTAFSKLPHRTKDRRLVSATLLFIVEKNQYTQSDDDGFFLSIVMGGLIPLLNQHASLPNADTLEIGRAGLRTLLPHLQWDFGLQGKKLQAASLVALINLMVGAYPIMPGHGGNIMSALLACWGHANRALGLLNESEERDVCQSVLVLSEHAASVAFILCRGGRAEQVLQSVQDGDFGNELKEHIVNVRQLASSHISAFAH